MKCIAKQLDEHKQIDNCNMPAFNLCIRRGGCVQDTEIDDNPTFINPFRKLCTGDHYITYNKCKKTENDNGYISTNFVQLNLNAKYKFISGPFSEKIFEVVGFQKNKIDIFLGNIKTRIKQNNFLFNSL